MDTPLTPHASSSSNAALTPSDQSHLKTLSICWMIYAGLQALGGLCGGLYLVFGLLTLAAGVASGDASGGGQGNGDAMVVGGVLIGVGLFTLVLVLPIAILSFLAGRGLNQHRRKVLIYVMAALACMSVPLGTLLGVFTFIVMGRPAVQAAFEKNRDANRY